jgi:hypothetical protein
MKDYGSPLSWSPSRSNNVHALPARLSDPNVELPPGQRHPDHPQAENKMKAIIDSTWSEVELYEQGIRNVAAM